VQFDGYVGALEDKIVQRATAAVLNAIYEEDFLGFSYGFRPGRGTHDALNALCVGIERKKVNWILDADIRSFFDEISQEWLIRFLEHRIGDRRIIHLIQKWLKAGILENGTVSASDRGTGQGSVISPLLANLYLHYALDLWAARWRRRVATGDMIFVRYADDFIVGFQYERDARRFLDEMRVRLQEFALSLHPEKTRLIQFGRFAEKDRKARGLGKPETFNFLGFTFICGKTRSGKFLLTRKTRRDRMRAKLRMIKQEMRRRMHQPIPKQGQWLHYVVRGYFNYHAVPTNFRSLVTFRTEVAKRWRGALSRRSERGDLNWVRMNELIAEWLPRPRILHPWPHHLRYAVTHSTRPSFSSFGRRSAPYRSLLILFSTQDATASLRWPHRTACQPSTNFVNLPLRAASSAMGRALRIPIVRAAFTPVAFSGAPSPPICRSCSRRISNSSSI
jgi:group II intron reverse transcriptase/maturase